LGFFFTGVLGFLWLIAWVLLYQPPHLSRFITAQEWNFLKDKVRPPGETRSDRGPRGAWIKLIRDRGCYSLLFARFFTDPVIYFVIFWLPEYLQKERHFDLAMVAKYAWVPYIFADFGYILGGWISGFLMRRGWPLIKARTIVLFCAALVMPVAILAPFVSEAWMAIGATCVITFGHALWISNLLTLPTDLFPGFRVGTVTGLSGMGGAVGGMLANLTTGYVVASFSYKPIFIAAGLMHPLSFCIVFFLLLRRLRVPAEGPAVQITH